MNNDLLSPAMNTAYLLLGSNIGNRESYLLRAIELLNEIGTRGGRRGTRVIAKSSVYNTAPWGNPSRWLSGQNDFLNQAIGIETKLSAEKLLSEILSIEKKMGRVRQLPSPEGEGLGVRWQPRTIDIDILFFNQDIINSKILTVPHPHLHERKFSLVPLNEITPDLIHPVLKKSVRTLLLECPDNLNVILHNRKI